MLLSSEAAQTSPDSPTVDEVDRRILTLLLEDARRSYADLGKRVGLTAPSVHARVKKLEDRGVIRGYSALLDPAKLGFGITAIVALRQAPGPYWEKLERAFAEMPEIEACHSVTGDDSYLLQVRVTDPRALEDLLRVINCLEGVGGTRTVLVLNTPFERRRVY